MLEVLPICLFPLLFFVIEARALELVKVNSSDINLKIQELSNAMYRCLEVGASTSTASYSNPYTDTVLLQTAEYKLVHPVLPDVTLRSLPFYRLQAGLTSRHTTNPLQLKLVLKRPWTSHITFVS